MNNENEILDPVTVVDESNISSPAILRILKEIKEHEAKTRCDKQREIDHHGYNRIHSRHNRGR